MKQNEYLALLSTAKGEPVDLSLELFRIIATEESEKDKIEAFQLICEISAVGDTDESVEIPKHYTEEERRELRSSVGIFVDSVLKFVSQKAYREHFSPTDFYELLWNMVFVEGLLNGEKENGFALYWIFVDRNIPYVSMEDKINIRPEKAIDFIDSNPLLAHRMRYIASFPLGKRTDRSALILQELESLDSIEEKAILLAYALSEIDKTNKQNNND